MSTDTDFIEYVHEQIGFGSRLSHKRMFGEYALYLDGKVVAFACDNSLLLKPTEAGRAMLPRVTPGKPYPEAKDYYVLDEFLDDTDLLQRIIQSTADALPVPRPKPGKKAKTAQAATNAKPAKSISKAKPETRADVKQVAKATTKAAETTKLPAGTTPRRPGP